MALKDAEILAMVRADHKQAFTGLYRQYYKMCEYFIVKNSGSPADAEDIFQETMMVIFHKSRDTAFQFTCDIKTYIYSVVRNLWLKELQKRKQKHAVRDYENYVTVSEVDEQEDDGPLLHQLQEAVEQLGEKCKKILQLVYFEKKSMDIIAAELGYTNADNAKNQKYKCLQQLKSTFNTNNG